MLTLLLAANELRLPFFERLTIAEFEERIDLEADLLTKVDEDRFRQTQSSNPSVNLLTTAAPMGYKRVPVHQILPGYAIPDTHIQTHMRCCKPLSTYLSMDSKE